MNCSFEAMESFKKIFGYVFVNSGMICPCKERKKNLKPIKPKHHTDLELIIVDTFQQQRYYQNNSRNLEFIVRLL